MSAERGTPSSDLLAAMAVSQQQTDGLSRSFDELQKKAKKLSVDFGGSSTSDDGGVSDPQHDILKDAEDLDDTRWDPMKCLRRLVYPNLLKGLFLVLVLIGLVSRLGEWIRWVNAPAAISHLTDCPIHWHNHIQPGMVPSMIQESFGKAAWIMPWLWKD